jgi:NAD(P)-dependent dehydrogenase (short-subunit alcohol dehydrogenase family)
LGLAICRRLARRGAAVLLTARDVERGLAAQAALADEGLEVAWHPLDVTSASDIETIRLHIERAYGRLDVLVNNAAIAPPGDGSIRAVSQAAVEHALATNCFAPMRVAQALLQLLERSGHARIVNVSSGAGALATAGTGIAAYRLSKACLNAITVLLAAELRPNRVAVNAVCPGRMRTRMGATAAAREPDDAAEGAVWLALDAPDDLTGKFLRDGVEIPW